MRLAKRPAPAFDYEFASWGMIDVLTLLLVFFIILYANEVKKPSLPAEPLQVKAEAVSPLPGFAPAQIRPRDLAAVSVDLREYFAGYLEKGFYISEQENQVTLVLEEQLTFRTGEAALNAHAAALLERILSLLLAESDCQVLIAGHTDDLPIQNAEFRSNWHLAAARAISVAEYFLAGGLAPERVVTQGFAEYQPLFPNDSEEHRQKNRRVEIVLRKKG